MRYSAMAFLRPSFPSLTFFDISFRLVLASFINYFLSQFLFRPYLINYANQAELLFEPFFPNFVRQENAKLQKMRQLLPPHQEPIPIICHTLAIFIALWLMNDKKVNMNNSITKTLKMGISLAIGSVIWTLNAQKISEHHLFFILCNSLHSVISTLTISLIMFGKLIPREKVE